MLSARKRRSLLALEKKSSRTVRAGIETQAMPKAMATTIMGISGSYGALTEYERKFSVFPWRP